MQLPSILPIAVAVFGAANAQVISYTSDGSVQSLVGVGFRCYMYNGKVNHVDAQPGVEAVFYNQPYCRGSREISAWGSTNLDSTFYFQSVELRPYEP
ncbi:hypothetical protein E4U55_005724 [Claviceps digitariae]|nr:hypothetical protein E4U55_005724 [Claviceps digitariae]